MIKITQTSLQSPSLKYSQSHFLKKEQAGNQSVLLKIKANRPQTSPEWRERKGRGRPRPYTSPLQPSGLSRRWSEEAVAEGHTAVPRGTTPPRGWRRDWRGGELQPRCGALSQNSTNMSAKIKVEHESPKNETKSTYI